MLIRHTIMLKIIKICMKKVIPLITLFVVGSVFADYDVRINQLPKDSIYFKKNSIEEPIPEPVPEPTPECLPMNYGSSYSYWHDNGVTTTSDPNYGSMVYWKGTRIAQNSIGSLQAKVSSFTAGGYRYTSDGVLGKTIKYSNTNYSGFFYGICRIPIN